MRRPSAGRWRGISRRAPRPAAGWAWPPPRGCPRVTAGGRCHSRAGCWRARAAAGAAAARAADRARRVAAPAGWRRAAVAPSGRRRRRGRPASSPSASASSLATRRSRSTGSARPGDALSSTSALTRSGHRAGQVQCHPTAHRVAEHRHPRAVAGDRAPRRDPRRSAPCRSAPGSAGASDRPCPIRSTAIVRRPAGGEHARPRGPRFGAAHEAVEQQQRRPVALLLDVQPDPVNPEARLMPVARSSAFDTASQTWRCSTTLRCAVGSHLHHLQATFGEARLHRAPKRLPRCSGGALSHRRFAPAAESRARAGCRTASRSAPARAAWGRNEKIPPPSLFSSTIVAFNGVLARREQAVGVVVEGDIADHQHQRPTRDGARAERGRDDAVDATGAAVGQAAKWRTAGRQEGIEVAHRHAVAGEEQRIGRQQPTQLGEHPAFERLVHRRERVLNGGARRPVGVLPAGQPCPSGWLTAELGR